jgi:drug/metabolite transporter (DMT)-like permease
MAVSLAVVAPALTCAVLWGIGPIFSKKGMDAGGTPRVATTVIITVSVVLFWTLGIATAGSSFLADLNQRDLLVFLGAGVFGTALGRLFLFAGIERVGASINTAGLNSRPLFVLVLGVGLLGEVVTPLQVLGILVIVVGIALLSLSKGGDLGAGSGATCCSRCWPPERWDCRTSSAGTGCQPRRRRRWRRWHSMRPAPSSCCWPMPR